VLCPIIEVGEFRLCHASGHGVEHTRSSELNAGEVIRLPENSIKRPGKSMDTAECCANLDAMVTTDTAMAHTQRRLGVRIALLLGSIPDLGDVGMTGDETPWYANTVC